MEAAAEYRALEARLVTARGSLGEAIVEAAKAKMPQTEIIKITGYSREHIRRILREGGVTSDPPRRPHEKASGD